MPEVKDLATQALTWLLDIINKWLDVAPQYVVDLVHRYWMFYWFASLFWVVISWIVLFLLIHYWIKGIKEEEEYWVALVVFSIFVLVPFVLCMIGMLKAFIVPEIVIIEALH